MRLVDCPNCFSSNLEESEQSDAFLVGRGGQKLRRFFGRSKIPKVCSAATGKGQNRYTLANRKYPIERKHKVKKRDLVNQLITPKTPKGISSNRDILVWDLRWWHMHRKFILKSEHTYIQSSSICFYSTSYYASDFQRWRILPYSLPL